MSACSASRCELTETYSPAAIERAPATRPATPAVTIDAAVDEAPATPTTIAATDTIPSFAPSTPARSWLRRLAETGVGAGARSGAAVGRGWISRAENVLIAPP